MIDLKVTKVGIRGFVFSFDDPYLFNIYVIVGKKHIFFCDTGLGSDNIIEILKYLKDQGINSKPFVVFNSHADYDHVWGNHMFRDSIIVAHELSPGIFDKEGEEILKNYSSHKRGDVVLTKPNKLFKDKYIFEDEGIEFYHSPGHTLESSSCYDSLNKILFVGDNIESPFPYVNFLNLEDYKASLTEYLIREVEIVVSGHDEVMYDTKLIESNLDYLDQLSQGKVDRSGFTKKHRGIHFHNLTRLGEMMKNSGNSDKARVYYEEALEILSEIDKTSEIEAKITEIQFILSELSE